MRWRGGLFAQIVQLLETRQEGERFVINGSERVAFELEHRDARSLLKHAGAQVSNVVVVQIAKREGATVYSLRYNQNKNAICISNLQFVEH